MEENELESSQHYHDASPHLNPKDHPAESQAKGESMEEVADRDGFLRAECVYYDGKYCNNEEEFDGATKVSGAYCSMCENWEPDDAISVDERKVDE